MATQSGPSIALFGLFGADNYGNEGSLAAMLCHLRAAYPGAQVSAICTYPQRVTADHGIPAVPIRQRLAYRRSTSVAVRALHRLFVRFPREILRWARTIAHMRQVDLLVVPGTGILDDYAVSPGDLPYGLFLWCVSARLAGAKVLFVSVGAGPITHPVSRWLMKSAARVAAYRSFRDQISKGFMTSLGLDTRRDAVYPDVTFNLPLPVARRTLAADRKPSVIGVGVMAYYGWRNNPEQGEEVFAAYVGKIADFVSWLLRHDYSVRLLVGEDRDAQAADLVVGRVRSTMGMIETGRLVVADMSSVEAVLLEIAATDVVIATRFHNLVWGILLDKPLISLGYTARHEALMSDVGLGKYCQHIESFDLATLIEHFSEVRDDWHRLERSVHEKRLEYQEWLRDQFDGPLRSFLGGRVTSR